MPLLGILGRFESHQKQFFVIFEAKYNKRKKLWKNRKISEKYRKLSGKIGQTKFLCIFLFEAHRKTIFRRNIGRKNRNFCPWSSVATTRMKEKICNKKIKYRKMEHRDMYSNEINRSCLRRLNSLRGCNQVEDELNSNSTPIKKSQNSSFF